ncbi:Demethylmenaquinone methyltransferase [Thermobacillus xylanilyticus]|uniref:Demethylmenaquinone methyltransferase n=1 Tax=Thermobacillus xylanilyticus TaxID=76633 RepID=A0ABN7S9P1_THEXY|nr:MerR family transcriptional regulator [Thermobacillus xylanilyticus]REJ14585.1 MAG: transcriptional regulator [Paenibacillaceae bacterium]CAG5091917.1 Demethylmenaquinone methyltransferase [Thermobacillus xylanilyticus]
MKIKEAAERLGISQRAIRFYEKQGLLSPSRQQHNGYREFGEEDIWRLQTIVALREAGMPIADIRTALAEIDAKDEGRLMELLELQRSVMFAKWVEMKQMIETADRMIETLRQNRTLPIDDIYQLAESSRILREQRAWEDRWGFDELAGDHDRLVREDKTKYPDYDEALRLIVKRAAPVRGERGLDIGTGTGNLAGLCLEAGAAMAAVDQSKEMLKACRRKFPEVETRLGNFLALPYLDGRFDFVVSSFALRHLTGSQILLAVQEMRRVLKPHGRICIADLMTIGESGACGSSETGLPLPALLDALETNGYITKLDQMGERLHVVLAVPVRPHRPG